MPSSQCPRFLRRKRRVSRETASVVSIPPPCPAIALRATAEGGIDFLDSSTGSPQALSTTSSVIGPTGRPSSSHPLAFGHFLTPPIGGTTCMSAVAFGSAEAETACLAEARQSEGGWPTATGSTALNPARARDKEKKIGVHAVARTYPFVMPTRHPMDPGNIPSVLSSRTQKTHSKCCPREAARSRHVSRAARMAAPSTPRQAGRPVCRVGMSPLF